MKHIVSVSLGSSKRNHVAEIELVGEKFKIERVGTDGDIQKAISIIRELDGKVDAFGMGGTDLHFVAGHKTYLLRDAIKIAKAAQKTPILDGSRLKGIIESRAVEYIRDELKIPLSGKKALIVCVIDRFGMAEALKRSGCQMMYGDLAFALGIPIWLRSLRTIEVVADIAMPLLSFVPIKYLYPVGKSQDEIRPKYENAYRWAEIIGGDFHFIKRHMPDDLSGKMIITNTVTSDDVDALRQRGVKMLVTGTPEIQGRSFATNVIEAVLVVLSGKPGSSLSDKDYVALLDEAGFKPRVEHLN
ncbi:MAG TPA: quinate 5-dehydrogenase [Firmicutes bacterium]|nr:quinate 5-dehydrogenase [Bacillota bacterium]